MKTKQLIKKKIEKFKNSQSFKQKYLNDPSKITKYRSERDKKYNDLSNNVFLSTNRIQTNQFINKNRLSKTKISKPNLNIGSKDISKQLQSEIFDPELEQIFNAIISEKEKSKVISKEKSNQNIKSDILNKSVQFDPIAKNPETKYKRYHESLFRLKPSEKLVDLNKPSIDQTISQNIMAYTNNGIETIYPNYMDVSNIEIYNFNKINNISESTSKIHNINDPNNINIRKMKGKTIKEIYDDITNDGRMNLQQNLDDLEANDKGSQFIIGEKYGATRFDTYSVR